MSATAACWTAAILLLALRTERIMCRAWELRVPQNHTALGGDLQVSVLDLPPGGARVELLRATAREQHFVVIGSVAVSWNADGGNVTSVRFPCGLVAQGGRYGVRLRTTSNYYNSSSKGLKGVGSGEQDTVTEKAKGPPPQSQDVSEIQEMDVRWPPVVLSLAPARVQTYPELPVTASLEFSRNKCRPATGVVGPELWLELLFCGHSPVGCTASNATHKQVMYAEQLRGYPHHLSLSLRCELFGLAGHYALTVRSAMPTAAEPVIHDAGVAAFLKVAWSDKFVFNVHARSIFPCDALSGGVAVLFQYPACILETGDRVRLFARLRADVASLAPPTSLHYKAEQRVTRGQHSLHFDCDLFSERYVEYCFVYVSQAITGAVSDVRVDCVPTLPVKESDSGGWGSWSAWTSCTTSCGGGTRNRYRLCDSPPPRYGAKFCEGPSLESQHCGVGTGTWDCPISAPSATDLVADRPEVQAEVGPGCRCGCIVHLGSAKPRRLLATSSKSCPGRTFWLVQADKDHVIRLSMQYFRLPCSSQWLKVRDGDSLSATLIAQLAGSHMALAPVVSSGAFLLLEFFSDELTAGGVDCGGSFLAHAQQIPPPTPVPHTTLIRGPGLDLTAVSAAPVSPPNLTVVHVASLLFVCVVLAVSACLAAQYLHRYRKYQLAAACEDTDGDTASGSLALQGSRATLLSEVISLKRFGRHRAHDRLQEEDEDGYESAEHEYEVIEDARKTSASSPCEPSAAVSLPCTPPQSPASLRRSSTLEQTPPISRLQVGSASPVHDDDDDAGGGERERRSEAGSERGWHVLAPGRPLSRGARTVSRGHSVITLTNGRSSPAASLLGRANPKEHKDKRNLERLLAGSEFSLAGPDHDLELDYYDYNVSNAGAVPGSFLGMDPAYLVWIPPFAPGCWEDESDQLLALAERQSQQELREYAAREELPEIATRALHELRELSAREDYSSPIDREQHDLCMEQVTEFIPRGRLSNGTPLNLNRPVNNRLDNKDSDSYQGVHKSNKDIDLRQNGSELQSILHLKEHTSEQLPLREFTATRKIQESPARVHHGYRPGEKETRVEKSPSDGNDFCDVLDDDDIKFVDDEDEEEEEEGDKTCDHIIITEPNKNHHIRA